MALTKSQKTQKRNAKADFDWLMDIPKYRPKLIENFGATHWYCEVMDANKRYHDACGEWLVDVMLFMIAFVNLALGKDPDPEEAYKKWLEDDEFRKAEMLRHGLNNA